MSKVPAGVPLISAVQAGQIFLAMAGFAKLIENGSGGPTVQHVAVWGFDKEQLAGDVRPLPGCSVQRAGQGITFLRRFAWLLACGFLAGGSPVMAQDAGDLVGWWSRLRPGAQGYVRDVIQFTGQGQYVSGMCLTTSQNGWCQAPAAPVANGSYSVRGQVLELENGLRFRADDFAAPSLYGWGVELLPDNPPTGRPPSRRLHLVTEAGERSRFNIMLVQPGWLTR